MASEQARLINLIERMSGRRRVRLDDNVNFDLVIEGDDAAELIDAIHKEFGTSFAGMDMRKYFKDEGFEIQLRFWRMGKLPLSIRHLLNVIEKGHWFEPSTG
jgi:Protein of unknown function (DUF1493)